MATQNDYPITAGTPVDYSTQWFKNPRVLAEKVLKCKVSSCSLTIPNITYHNVEKGTTQCIPTTIPFYMSQDFGFGLSNEWSSMVNTSENEFVNLLNGWAAFNNETQIALQSEIMSAKIYKGSTFDPFNVSCLFVCTNRSINPLEPLKLLASTCLPTPLERNEASCGNGLSFIKNIGTGVNDFAYKIGSMAMDNFSGDTAASIKEGLDTLHKGINKSIDTVGIMAPLHYGVQIDGDENTTTSISPKKNTTVTLRIGNYFRASELLVQNISNVTISKEVIAPPVQTQIYNQDLYNNNPGGSDYGFPLYVKCNVTLIPFSMVTKQKFNSYIKTNNKSNPYTTARDVAKDVFRLP